MVLHSKGIYRCSQDENQTTSKRLECSIKLYSTQYGQTMGNIMIWIHDVEWNTTKNLVNISLSHGLTMF